MTIWKTYQALISYSEWNRVAFFPLTCGCRVRCAQSRVSPLWMTLGSHTALGEYCVTGQSLGQSILLCPGCYRARLSFQFGVELLYA